MTGVTATMDGKGTLVSWANPADSELAYYEVFRSVDSNFTPGPGSYIASVSSNHYYDNQMRTGLANTYYYKIRAVRAGAKGDFSTAVSPTSGADYDNQAPSSPTLAVDYTTIGRASISWTPSTDNVLVKENNVYRDGVLVATLAPGINSYLDAEVSPGAHTYMVKSKDWNNNASANSNMLSVTVPVKRDGNISSSATITASSYYQNNDQYSFLNVKDGKIGIHGAGEWASNGEPNPWIKLDWGTTSRNIDTIVLYE